jgi:aspartyl-tRNA(Asn)/glutamyl-tRNA(Gln) amidotransferase subunit A
MKNLSSLRTLAGALGKAQITATELVEQALFRASTSNAVFITLNEGLTSLAKAIDAARKRGDNVPPLAGIPITLKDLFNVRNEITLAGSIVGKSQAKPESEDAEVVAPLRDAGLLFLGRTNMSEFAFSGIGKNPHYGTPLSIWDRDTGRLPGGSSSGSAVSVAEGVVVATLGSDTAGSCRIPAAFNSIVGVKPSFGRMSLKGIYPLSPTSDAPGPLANDVDSCYLLDRLMCGLQAPQDALPELKPRDIKSLKLVVPQSAVLTDLDDEVQTAFDNSLEVLRNSGASIEFVEMSSIDDCIDMFANRAVVIHEAYHHHREMLEQHGDQFDPFVAQRLLTGSTISDQQQLERYHEKARIIEQFNQQFRASGADALLYPTVACIPPAISETEDLDNARIVNLRCLRNTATANYYDGCSISLPCHKLGTAPVGLMVSAMNGDDEDLYAISATIERAISQIR